MGVLSNERMSERNRESGNNKVKGTWTSEWAANECNVLNHAST